MEKIAVVIPTYKPQGYLKKCLDSMEFQTLDKRRFCVYVALNGDKFPYENKVLSLLKSYSFEFKYIYIELASVSNARNKLIEYSDEKLLTFVDDDDFISPNYLEALVDVTTDSVMGVSNMIEEDGGGKPKSHYTSQTYNNLACNQSKFRTRKIYSSACAKAIHRKMIGKIRFDVNLRNGEDSLFMATISNNILDLKKSQATYYVYQRRGSASRTKRVLKNRIGNATYLIKAYFKLLVSLKYNVLFILTRIVAEFRKIFIW